MHHIPCRGNLAQGLNTQCLHVNIVHCAYVAVTGTDERDKEFYNPIKRD